MKFVERGETMARRIDKKTLREMISNANVYGMYLTRDDLHEIGSRLGVYVTTRMRRDELLDAIYENADYEGLIRCLIDKAQSMVAQFEGTPWEEDYVPKLRSLIRTLEGSLKEETEELTRQDFLDLAKSLSFPKMVMRRVFQRVMNQEAVSSYDSRKTAEWIFDVVKGEGKLKDYIKALLEDDYAVEWLERRSPELLEKFRRYVAPEAAKEKKKSLHEEIKDKLVELGKLEGKVAIKEFKLPHSNFRYDVVWKRTERGGPTHAFQVQISGNLENALVSLKEIYDYGCENLFLIVGSDKDYRRAEALLKSSFHDTIAERTTLWRVEEFEEFYESEKKHHEIKKKLR